LSLVSAESIPAPELARGRQMATGEHGFIWLVVDLEKRGLALAG
jgi:hypothetical protein